MKAEDSLACAGRDEKAWTDADATLEAADPAPTSEPLYLDRHDEGTVDHHVISNTFMQLTYTSSADMSCADDISLAVIIVV